MSITAPSEREALAIARRLSALHAGTDWIVRVHRPLFEGDAWHVSVGS